MNTEDDCDICYETSMSIISLTCCKKSKKICDSCLNCLKTPLCPWCRVELDKQLLKNNKNINSKSLPIPGLIQSWGEYIDNQTTINPYSYDDSRRLRRQMRRLRYGYLQYVTREQRQNNISNTNIRSRNRNRRRRDIQQQIDEDQQDFFDDYFQFNLEI